MYLTYLDDGGKGDVRVFGGIVLEDRLFDVLETASAIVATRLIRKDPKKFEFHASDLYAGTNQFEGIRKEDRYAALLELIRVAAMCGATYVYSAIDIQKLQRGPSRSARWTDMAFFMCACAVDAEVLSRSMDAFLRAKEASQARGDRAFSMPTRLTLLVIDEPERDGDRPLMRATFRELRGLASQLVRPLLEGQSGVVPASRLGSCVDDVFFGSSVNSIGLQVADVCNWVMWRHLREGIRDEFFEELLRGRVVCAKCEPEWTEYRHLFKTHE